MADFLNFDPSKTNALEDLKSIATRRNPPTTEKEFEELDRLLEDDEAFSFKAQTKFMLDKLSGDSHKPSGKRIRVAEKSNTQVAALTSDHDKLEQELADTAQSAAPALSAPPSPPSPEAPPQPVAASPINVGFRVPRVKIHSQNRCYRLRDEEDEDDFVYMKLFASIIANRAPNLDEFYGFPKIDDQAEGDGENDLAIVENPNPFPENKDE